MMKRIILSILFLMIGVIIINHKKIPQIKLPGIMRHNTIASLPIMELADNSGKGDLTKLILHTQQEQCYSVFASQCEYGRKEQDWGNKKLSVCLKKAYEMCQTGIPSCEEEAKWAKKFAVNFCYTCWGGWID